MHAGSSLGSQPARGAPAWPSLPAADLVCRCRDSSNSRLPVHRSLDRGNAQRQADDQCLLHNGGCLRITVAGGWHASLDCSQPESRLRAGREDTVPREGHRCVRPFPQQRSTMQTNHSSTAASGGTPRLALVATAAVLATAAALAFLLLDPMGSDAAQSSGPIVSTASTSLGRILVNSGGRTLYVFSRDKNDKSACAGMCAKFWPP